MIAIERLILSLVVAGGALVAISYFLPSEDVEWSGFRAAQGYTAGGGSLQGPVVALFETAPAVCGLVLPLALVVSRRRKLASAILLGYLGLWLSVGALYAFQFFALPEIRLTALWALAGLTALLGIVVLAFFLIRRWSSTGSVSATALILGGCLLIFQIAQIVFIRLEDELLLNYGAVTSAVGATTLFVALLFHHQLHRDTGIPKHGELPLSKPTSVRRMFLQFFGIAAAGVLVLWCCAVIYLYFVLSRSSLSKAGVFGDSFGVLNTLFSGLAFAGVVAALLVQLQEFRRQQQAFDHQQEESEQSHKLHLLTTYLDSLNIKLNNNENIIRKKSSNDAKRYRLKIANKRILEETHQIVEYLRPTTSWVWTRRPNRLEYLIPYVSDIVELIGKFKEMATREHPVPPEHLRDQLEAMLQDLFFHRNVNDKDKYVREECVKICMQIALDVQALQDNILDQSKSPQEKGQFFDLASNQVAEGMHKLRGLTLPKSKSPDDSPPQT